MAAGPAAFPSLNLTEAPASFTDPGRPVSLEGMRTIFDGSRLLPTGTPLWHIWAFGTYRLNGCYYSSSAACAMQMVWHVGGPAGFNTKAVPNGTYKYCVEALTIAGVDAQRCTPVTITN